MSNKNQENPPMPKQFLPEKVQVTANALGDKTTYNTVVKPFKDIFNEPIFLVAPGENNEESIVFGKTYDLRIIEALVGTWLGRVAYYIFGNEEEAYNEAAIALIDKTIAKTLQKRVIIGEGEKPNFPDVYQKGDVPAGYDEDNFNPNEIYPGQRFMIIRPIGEIIFEEGMVITVESSFLDKLWVGATWGWSADLGPIGAHTTLPGAICNLGDLKRFGQLRRFAGLSIHGWKLGFGLGASTGAAISIFCNYDDITQINKYEAGWDFDIAFGGSIVKGALKGITRLFPLIKSLKGVEMFESIDSNKVKLIEHWVQAIIKNLKGAWPFKGQFNITIPLPGTGPGLHFWVGKKVSQIETFEEPEFASKAEW